MTRWLMWSFAVWLKPFCVDGNVEPKKLHHRLVHRIQHQAKGKPKSRKLFNGTTNGNLWVFSVCICALDIEFVCTLLFLKHSKLLENTHCECVCERWTSGLIRKRQQQLLRTYSRAHVTLYPYIFNHSFITRPSDTSVIIGNKRMRSD